MKLILPYTDSFIKDPDLFKELDFLEYVKILSIVGAGGKTSILKAIARAYLKKGKKAAVTTTAHMFYPEKEWKFTETKELDKIMELLDKNNILWIGSPCDKINVDKRQKITGTGEETINYLREHSVPVLIEADGARRLPFKVPGEEEPVILPQSSHVIGVLGMDALGHRLKEVCFRWELALELLCKTGEDVLLEKDYIKVIRSREGLGKNVKSHMRYVVFLNKADNQERKDAALRIREQLWKYGIQDVYITSFSI